MWKYLVAAMLLPSILFISCQKNAGDVQRQGVVAGDIVPLLQNLSSASKKMDDGEARNTTPRQASFNLLSFAIAKAGLTNELNNPRFAYTLFAPTDEAFAAIGLSTKDAIDCVPGDQLKAILLYHVIGTKVLAQVPTTYTELTTLDNSKAYIIRKSNGVFINGSAVVAADIDAKSGVIHAINRVLLPPQGNIVEVAAANPNFSYLVAAVQRAGLVTIASIQAAPPSDTYLSRYSGKSILIRS